MPRYPARIPRNVPRSIRERDPGACEDHRKWVAKQRCAVEDADCGGKVVAAHVRIGTDGALGKKPADRWCVPLCSFHHTDGGLKAQHVEGERSFWSKRGIDPKALAERYAARSPALARAKTCEECGIYLADPPSRICPGCEAYRDHAGRGA